MRGGDQSDPSNDGLWRVIDLCIGAGFGLDSTISERYFENRIDSEVVGSEVDPIARFTVLGVAACLLLAIDLCNLNAVYDAAIEDSFSHTSVLGRLDIARRPYCHPSRTIR